MKKSITLIIVFISLLGNVYAHTGAKIAADSMKVKTTYAENTFEAPRIVLGQSIESPDKGDLILNIQHHFGYVNEGAYQFFGLDQATVRLGFEYGITNWLMVGIGRSSYGKTVDGSFKVKILRQSNGGKNMPVSVSFFEDMGINTLKPKDLPSNSIFSNRLAFLSQILIARKFNDKLSLQLAPSWVHRSQAMQENNVFALGTSGRIKVGRHTSLDLEYYSILSKQTASEYQNSLSVGFNIQAGGHVFQLYVSNSLGITGQNFIPGTQGNWLKGDILIGFNITRRFHLIQPKYY
ncbi:MAG: hypothetical protein JXR71_10000 [Bacteroidales bacterium]|nr:hypothetical protein [Bacteroidales bacterium]